MRLCLDIDKDYYYALRVEHIDPIIQKISSNISSIQRIKLLRDNEFYFLDKEIYDPKDKEDKNY